MRWWKLAGLAGVIGLSTGAVVVSRRRARAWEEYQPDEVRERLHERFGSSGTTSE